MILSVLSHTISERFPDADIHKEQASHIDRPAFYIAVLKDEQRKSIGNRYVRDSSLVIRYFPEKDDSSSYEELRYIADILYFITEKMVYQGVYLRGLERNSRIEDNVLQFFLHVQQPLKRPEDVSKMETIETNVNKKGE